MPKPTLESMTHNRDMLAIEQEALSERVKELTQQRDELLAAAKALRECMQFWASDPSSQLGKARDRLDAAIAKAEGEKE